MKTTTVKQNQITLTLSDTQMKKIIRLQKIITCPRIVNFEYLKLKLNTEEITKEQIISSMLDKALEDIGRRGLAYEPIIEKIRQPQT